MARQQATCHSDLPNYAFGKCKKCYNASWRREHRAHVNAKARAWHKEHPQYALEKTRKRRYGIDADVVAAMLREQGGVCKICTSRTATDVDHDHKTGVVRGMLCGSCNTALGQFKDSTAILSRASAYVEGRL